MCASDLVVILAFQAKVSASRVLVRYVMTNPAKLALSVKPSRGKATTVRTTNGKAGIGTISWNRRLHAKKAKAGTYGLTITATANGKKAPTTIKIRLR